MKLGPPSGEWKHKSSLQLTALYFAFRVTQLGAGPLENCNDKKSCYRSDEKQIDYSIEIFFCEWFKRITCLIYTCNIDACRVKGQRTHALVCIFIPDEMQSTRFSRERHFAGHERINRNSRRSGRVRKDARWERRTYGFLAGFPHGGGHTGEQQYIISWCQIKQLACALTRVRRF